MVVVKKVESGGDVKRRSRACSSRLIRGDKEMEETRLSDGGVGLACLRVCGFLGVWDVGCFVVYLDREGK